MFIDLLMIFILIIILDVKVNKELTLKDFSSNAIDVQFIDDLLT